MIRKKVRSMQSQRTLGGVCLAVPSFLIVAVFFMIPMVMSLVFSFTNWTAINFNFSFVGLKNYINVIQAQSFPRVMYNTLFLAILYVPILNVLALTLATMIYNIGKKSGNLYKSVLFFPNLLSPTVVGFIWLLMFNFQNGMINKALRSIGLTFMTQDWLGKASTVLPAISISVLWFALGYFLIIYTASLTTIPEELYECAEVEGASTYQKFMKITIPMLAPAITINTILSSIGVIAVFEQPMVMTNGGPGYLSETLGLQVFHYAYKLRLHGEALATAMIMALLAGTIAFIEWAILSRKEDIY